MSAHQDDRDPRCLWREDELRKNSAALGKESAAEPAPQQASTDQRLDDVMTALREMIGAEAMLIHLTGDPNYRAIALGPFWKASLEKIYRDHEAIVRDFLKQSASLTTQGATDATHAGN